VVEVDDPEEGLILHVGPLLEFSATAGAVGGPAPRSGQHTEEVLAESLSVSARSDPGLVSQDSLAHPLAGIRVLDLGLGVAGPFTGRALADLGADVIKINALHDTYWNGTHMGLGTNRGKRSIALNLKNPSGREVLERLLQVSDVITLNWRPGAAARLGLDYESLRERHPALVYCNTRGYEKGPRSDLPGTDQNAAAMTGTEWEDGACAAGNPPLWSRSNMGDTGNALLAAIAITTALYHRDRTGEGQAVSTSIVNAGLLHTSHAWIHSDGRAPDWGQVDGDQFGLSPYYRLYRCALGEWVFLAAITSEARTALRTLLPSAPPAEDDESVVKWLGSYFGNTVAKEAFEALDDRGIPIEVVDEFFCRNLFDDPDAKRLNLISETRSSSVGRFEDPGLLVNISPSEAVIQRGPCACGEQTREILNELGYSGTLVEAMVESRAVMDGER
jgi:crotonobetainyl-CoA:carnitine CoA-transferase CaiB-like acyl-CoA transferase